MELRILINGVIAEVAQRAKRVNLITLLSRYGCSYLSLPYVDGRVEFIESFQRNNALHQNNNREHI